MTFASPHILWLALLPALWLVWELTRRRRATTSSHPKILRAEAGSHSLQLSAHNSLLSSSSGGATARPWLCLGLALAVVALARPQWGRLEEPVFDQSREILIAIDLSRSMLSPDVKPSRLDRAKLLTQSLLEKLTGERVGLVVFSGTAFLQSPLSSDYEILREFLPALNPDFLPEGGTNYQALIDTSLAAFGSTGAADRFLIILSDGEATDDSWRERLPDLKTKGIRVIGLGVGTAAGAMIPDGSGGLVKDDRGAVVLSKLESKTLTDLAESTNGTYQDASSWIDLAALINVTVDAGKKGEFTEKNTVRLVERFQWPLAFAVWCLLVSFYYEFPVRPKPRAIKLAAAPVGTPPPTATRTTTAALALCLLLPLASRLMPSSAAAAEDTGPQLGKIYARLAAQDGLSAQDYAEVARETLRWGKRIQENGQPITPGPVHDAIQAVDALIAKDSKIADWTKLRGELEALLKKPDDQKQDKKDDQQKQQDQKDQQQNQDKQNQDQSKQDQQKQDQSKQDQQEKSDQQKQQDQSQKQDPSKSDDAKKQPPKPENQENKDSAFGDMKDRKPPPPQPQDSQKVGGVPEKKDGEQPPPGDPSLALPLQKLDQLRNQDSPAELFQLMEGDKKAPAKKTGKNW